MYCRSALFFTIHVSLLRTVPSLNSTRVSGSACVPGVVVMILGDVADSPGGGVSHRTLRGRHESLCVHEPGLGPSPEHEVVVHGQTALWACTQVIDVVTGGVKGHVGFRFNDQVVLDGDIGPVPERFPSERPL